MISELQELAPPRHALSPASRAAARQASPLRPPRGTFVPCEFAEDEAAVEIAIEGAAPRPGLDSPRRISTEAFDPEAVETGIRRFLREQESKPKEPNAAQPARVSGEDDFVVRLYLREALAEPRLSPAEEPECAWLARFGDESARDRLVRGTLRLVLYIALGYRGYGLPLADLINEGNLGLMRAAELFNPTYGLRFGDYAGAWIRQRMRRALSYQAWPVRLPAEFTRQRARLQSAVERLENTLGRTPHDGEVAAESGLSPGVVRQFRASGDLSFVPLDASASPDGEGPTPADELADESAEGPDRKAAQGSDREFVERLLATLQPREREVLRLRFGLADGGERTLEETGRALGFVKQRIQQLESAALEKLRQRARSMEAPAYGET